LPSSLKGPARIGPGFRNRDSFEKLIFVFFVTFVFFVSFVLLWF